MPWSVYTRTRSHAAARRALLEDVAVEVGLRQLPHPPFRPALHRLGVIGSGAAFDEAGFALSADQPERFARHAEAHLDLGTDGDPLDELAQSVGRPGVTLVLAVPANPFADQAGRHANPDRRGLGRRPIYASRCAPRHPAPAGSGPSRSRRRASGHRRRQPASRPASGACVAGGAGSRRIPDPDARPTR